LSKDFLLAKESVEDWKSEISNLLQSVSNYKLEAQSVDAFGKLRLF